MKKQVNRNYKDTVFRMLFKEAKNALTLYNSLNGTHYTDAAMLEYNTLENAIYMNVKNDVSFLIASRMNLYEHQSTWNPNMPLRNLLYAAQAELSAAVERAVDECIREGVLKEFLLKQRSEVIMVSIYEYDEEKEMKLIRADERKIGIEQGIEQGESKLAQLMSRLFADGRADDAQRAASDENDRKALYKEYGFF